MRRLSALNCLPFLAGDLSTGLLRVVPGRMSSLFPLGLLVVFVSACGGSSSSPVSPGSPPPSQLRATVTDLSINGSEVVPIGFTLTYTATATLSNGATITPAWPTSWSTDSGDVATIDNSGRLTARGPGAVTITATHEARIATRTLRVPVMNNSSGVANLVISFKPDPVPGTDKQCEWGPGNLPVWRFTVSIEEINGVGFRMSKEIGNLHDADGTEIGNLHDADGTLVSTTEEVDDLYFPPKTLYEAEDCFVLPTFTKKVGSFFISVALEGIDDRGTLLTLASKRLELLRLSGMGPTARERLPGSAGSTRHILRHGR